MEEELTEKLTLLQELSQKEEEGKRLMRQRMNVKAASEHERQWVSHQDKLDACLQAMRAGM